MFPGIMMAVVVALAARFISEHYGGPVMLMALSIGMAFNFLTEDDGKCVAGIEFSAKALLRVGLALVLVGFLGGAYLRATLHDVAQVVGAGYAL